MRGMEMIKSTIKILNLPEKNMSNYKVVQLKKSLFFFPKDVQYFKAQSKREKFNNIFGIKEG